MKPVGGDQIRINGFDSLRALSLFQVEGMPAFWPLVVELTVEGEDRAYPAGQERTLDTQCGDCACE